MKQLLIYAAVAASIVGLLAWVVTIEPKQADEHIQSTITHQNEEVIEESEPEVKEAVKPEAKPAPKLDPIKDNPNECDLDKQYVWADFTCHDKPVEPVKKAETVPSASVTQPTTKVSSGSVEAIIRSYDWNDETALAVARCESGLNPSAVGDNYPIGGLHAPSVGVFQIRLLAGRPSRAYLLNAANNVEYAYNMWKSQGWSPWTCYRKI